MFPLPSTIPHQRSWTQSTTAMSFYFVNNTYPLCALPIRASPSCLLAASHVDSDSALHLPLGQEELAEESPPPVHEPQAATETQEHAQEQLEAAAQRSMLSALCSKVTEILALFMAS